MPTVRIEVEFEIETVPMESDCRDHSAGYYPDGRIAHRSEDTAVDLAADSADRSSAPRP